MNKFVMFLCFTLVSFSLLTLPSFANDTPPSTVEIQSFVHEKWAYKVVNIVGELEAHFNALSESQKNDIRNGKGMSEEEIIIKFMEDKFNALGDKGWEMITVQEKAAIFKRIKKK